MALSELSSAGDVLEATSRLPAVADTKSQGRAAYPAGGDATADAYLAQTRPDLAHVSRLTSTVDYAALLLSSAFALGRVSDFEPAKVKAAARRAGATQWYGAVVDAGLGRLIDVRNALVHDWSPPHEAEALVRGAFVALAELVPAREQLVELYATDARRALEMLGSHLDLLEKQARLTARLVADLEDENTLISGDEDRFIAARADLVDRAGALCSLTEAARRMGKTRQAVHQQIQRGSILGFMNGSQIRLPAFQFDDAQESRILPGLSSILELFQKAEEGALSALQFLIESDPNLGETPLSALVAGKVETVQHAASAYLGLTDG